MEKLVDVVWSPDAPGGTGLRTQLLGPVAKQLQEHGARQLCVNVADDGSPTPLRTSEDQ